MHLRVVAGPNGILCRRTNDLVWTNRWTLFEAKDVPGSVVPLSDPIILRYTFEVSNTTATLGIKDHRKYNIGN